MHDRETHHGLRRHRGTRSRGAAHCRVGGIPSGRGVRHMRRSRKQAWTPAQLDRLSRLISEGASAVRASAALKRTIVAVQTKANSLGTPFPLMRKVKAERLAREMSERNRTASAASQGSSAPK